MIEAGITAGVALIAGFATLQQKLHHRITKLDDRMDSMQLTVARDYVTKGDLDASMEKLESHMIRIESKIDDFIRNGRNG
jgi:bacterioferritin (cytochrome b1)